MKTHEKYLNESIATDAKKASQNPMILNELESIAKSLEKIRLYADEHVGNANTPGLWFAIKKDLSSLVQQKEWKKFKFSNYLKYIK